MSFRAGVRGGVNFETKENEGDEVTQASCPPLRYFFPSAKVRIGFVHIDAEAQWKTNRKK
jgi:hypothetical protein